MLSSVKIHSTAHAQHPTSVEHLLQFAANVAYV